MTDTIAAETPALKRVSAKHIKMACGAIRDFMKKHEAKGWKNPVCRKQLVAAVFRRIRDEGFDRENAEYATRKAVTQLIDVGTIEIVPAAPVEAGRKQAPVTYRLKGE